MRRRVCRRKQWTSGRANTTTRHDTTFHGRELPSGPHRHSPPPGLQARTVRPDRRPARLRPRAARSRGAPAAGGARRAGARGGGGSPPGPRRAPSSSSSRAASRSSRKEELSLVLAPTAKRSGTKPRNGFVAGWGQRGGGGGGVQRIDHTEEGVWTAPGPGGPRDRPPRAVARPVTLDCNLSCLHRRAEVWDGSGSCRPLRGAGAPRRACCGGRGRASGEVRDPAGPGQEHTRDRPRPGPPRREQGERAQTTTAAAVLAAPGGTKCS